MACFGSAPTFISHILTYDAASCQLTSQVTISLPCGSSGYKVRWYFKKGSAPSGIGPEIAAPDQALSAGPGTDVKSTTISLNCQGTGTFYVMAAVICDGVNQSVNTQNYTVSADSSTNPSLGTPVARLDAAVAGHCKVSVTCDVNMPCGAEDHTAKLYWSRGGAPAAVPNNQIGAELPVLCGKATRVLSWGNIDAPVDGTWHFKIVLYRLGVLVITAETQIEIVGCEGDPTIPTTPTGLSIPHEGVDELIFLMKVNRNGPTANDYTFTEYRMLSQSYQLLDWWYSRNGGCGSFRLLLREDFPERQIAIRDGWEIWVKIKLEGDTAYTTWYRGVIRVVERLRQGAELMTEIRGQGYLEQALLVQVQRRYPKNIPVDQIVRDIVQNYLVPNTRILNTLTNMGVDDSSYLTVGPLHFECSALKAIKFLAELQGDREFGVGSDRQFYFRQKKTSIDDGIFTADGTVVNVIDGGMEVERLNLVKVGGKQWGHDEEIVEVRDVTDISNYGLYEKPIDVPWVEHRSDAAQWANNLIAKRKGRNVWKTISLSEVRTRLERGHSLAGLDMVRIYGLDVSNDFDDLDVTKIHYYKGGFIHRSEVREIHRPKAENLIDQPTLRAVIYAGSHHHDMIEELEENVYSQIQALKAKDKQFRNPRVDVTNPDVNEINTIPGQLWLQPKADDVTNGPFRMRFREDLTNWPDLVVMRFGDVSNQPGNFVGEEFVVWDNADRTQGTKYYWNGTAWVSMSGGGAGGSGLTAAQVALRALLRL